MEELSIEVLDRLKLIHKDSSVELLPLYQAAVKDLELNVAEYLCIRDLAGFAGICDPALHALLILMFAQLNEGSLCLKIQKASLANYLHARLGLPKAEDMAGQICENIIGAKYAPIIGASEKDYLPLIFSDEYLYFQTCFKSRKALADSFNRLVKRGLMPVDQNLNRLGQVLKEILVENPIRMNGNPVTFNHEQKKALILSLVSPVTIISGGPGTGKTSVIISILRVLVRCGVKTECIRLTAPTGRAAMRIKETVSEGIKTLGNKSDDELMAIQDSTIHRLLGYNAAQNRFEHNAQNPIQADVVFIDEVSMVDLAMMARLLDALPPNARVIFLGDQDQLPSVEAGAVMADLLITKTPVYSQAFKSIVNQLDTDLEIQASDTPASHADKIVILNETYRSEKSILNIANAIKMNVPGSEIISRIPILSIGRTGKVSEQSAENQCPLKIEWPVPEKDKQGFRCKDGGCRRIAAEDIESDVFRDIIRSWVEHHYKNNSYGFSETYKDLVRQASRKLTAGSEQQSSSNGPLHQIFQLINRARILSLVRKGPFGCEQINDVALEQFNIGGQSGNLNGVPILVTHNAYNLGLFNGDVGVLLQSGRGGGYRAVFDDRHSGFRSIPRYMLPAHEYAFAMTVHKSQGSEYGQILLVLPDDETSRLLVKEIVYTGLTRAQLLAVIFGTENILTKAIAQKAHRETGPGLW